MKTTDFSEYIIRQRNIKIGAVAALIAAIAGNYLWTPEIGGAAFATFYLVVFALAILTVCIKSKKAFRYFGEYAFCFLCRLYSILLQFRHGWA
jgi:O-antigen/teichoic acid export membrane protein